MRRMILVVLLAALASTVLCADSDLLIRAPRFARPPRLDGELSEWTGLPPRVVASQADVCYDTWQGPSDLSAAFWVAWDDLHLYFAAEITDDYHTPHADMNSLGLMFKSDCIQLAFDLGLERSTSAYDDNDYEIGLGDTVEGPRVFRWHAGSAGLLTGMVPEIELTVARRGTVTVYEAAIPWQQLLSFSPSQSSRLGFSALFADNDGSGLVGYGTWAGGIAGGKNPSLFGTLQLLPGTLSGTLAAWLVAPVRLSDESSVPVTLSVWSPTTAASVVAELQVFREEEAVFSASRTCDLPMGTTDLTFTWPAGEVLPGAYVLWAQLRNGETVLVDATLPVTKFDPENIRRQLERVEQKVQKLSELLKTARNQGRQAAYQEVSLATAEINLPHARAYLDKEEYAKTADFTADLEEIIDQGRAETAALLADSEKDLVVPEVPTHPLQIREGTFYVGDEPVLLLGPLGWWHLYDEIRWLPRLGFNSVSLVLVPEPDTVLPSPEGPAATDTTAAVGWALAEANEAGIGATLFLHHSSWKTMPNWAVEQGVVDPASPQWREIIRRYYEAHTCHTWFYPNLHFYTIFGESWLGPRAITALTKANFARWLRARHLTVDRLREVWATDFGSFEAAAEVLVEPDKTNPGIYYDYGLFLGEYSAQNTRWHARTLKELHPGAYTQIYPSYLQFDDPTDFPEQDIELLCQATGLNGADTTWALDSPKYASGTVLWREVLLQDLLKSMSPGQPNVDGELHLVNYKVDYSEAYVRSILLQAYLHGLAGAYIWVWERGDTWDTQLLDKPHVLHAAGRTALDLRRLADRIVQFPQAPAKVAILYSRASRAYDATTFTETDSVYEAMFFTDAPVDFVTERQAAAGGLSKYKLVICPATVQVPDRTYRAFRRYAGDGGSLMLVGDCFAEDEYCRPRQVRLSGDILRLPLGTSAEDCRQRLETKLKELGIIPEVRVTDPRGRRLWGVECRSVRTEEGKLLCYVHNMSKEPQVVALAGAPGQVLDLLTYREVTFPRQMAPLDIVMFEAPRGPDGTANIEG